jgi:NAD(P)-dependent dehydrogenase (short-subunit alcohol dehydrogenase family)
LEVLPLDVNDAAQVQSAAADVRARHGEHCLYALVNNAGIAGGAAAADVVIDTNLRGVKRVTDAFAPLVAPSGRVVNVSSGSAPMFVAECAPERVRFFRNAAVPWETLDAAAKEYVAACEQGEDALAALGYPRKPNPCAHPAREQPLPPVPAGADPACARL